MPREDRLKCLQDSRLSDILVFAVKQLKLQFSSAGQDVKFLREYAAQQLRERLTQKIREAAQPDRAHVQQVDQRHDCAA